MLPPNPRGWHTQLRNDDAPYFLELERRLDEEADRHTVYPYRDEIFEALELTSLRSTRVLILGQDPYANPGQAHGLAFSVRPGVTPPPSLRNIFKELESDLGIPRPATGYLLPWARQGVLLLNAVLTVRAGKPGSHAGWGWEAFTDQVIRRVAAKKSRVVFVLWGACARKRASLIERPEHVVLTGPHPSPLSARRGFFGSRPFSKINAALAEVGEKPIDWALQTATEPQG
jgi:uracil-DNA glycosylase